MRFRTSYYAKPSAQEPHPQFLANPTVDYASLEQAREAAFTDANGPAIQAHLIIIESVDDGSRQRVVAAA
jgi:hypothetical protein